MARLKACPEFPFEMGLAASRIPASYEARNPGSARGRVSACDRCLHGLCLFNALQYVLHEVAAILVIHRCGEPHVTGGVQSRVRLRKLFVPDGSDVPPVPRGSRVVPYAERGEWDIARVRSTRTVGFLANRANRFPLPPPLRLWRLPRRNKLKLRLQPKHPNRRQVLDCGSPLRLSIASTRQKRQRTGALQNAKHLPQPSRKHHRCSASARALRH